MSRYLLSCLIAACIINTPAVTLAQYGAQDYPQWRGPHRDGAAATFVVPAAWPDHCQGGVGQLQGRSDVRTSCHCLWVSPAHPGGTRS